MSDDWYRNAPSVEELHAEALLKYGAELHAELGDNEVSTFQLWFDAEFERGYWETFDRLVGF